MGFGENRPGSQSLITGLFVTALAMVGLVDSDDLRSVKPTGSGVWKPVRPSPSMIHARLWEDPLEAVARALPHDHPEWGRWRIGQGQEDGELCYGFMPERPAARDPDALEGPIEPPLFPPGVSHSGARRQERADDVTVMAVTLRKGASAEDREWRLRTRYGVLAGLLDAGLEPEDGDFLGAFRVGPRGLHRQQGDPEAVESSSAVAVPFEWWHGESGEGGKPGVSALVLWVDESVMEISAGAALELLGEVRSSVARNPVPGEAEDVRSVLIGPTDSGLRDTLLEAVRGGGHTKGTERTVWYSPWATVPVGGDDRSHLRQTIGSDDLLVDALVRELASRYRPSADHSTLCGPGRCFGIGPSHAGDHCRPPDPGSLVLDPARERDHAPERGILAKHLDIALVAEADSSYGRYWQGAFEDGLARFDEAMKPSTPPSDDEEGATRSDEAMRPRKPEWEATHTRYVQGLSVRLLPTLSYVRGIDGFIPGARPSSSGSGSSGGGSNGNASAELVRAMAALQDSDFGEKASGTSQFDYLRRAELGLEGRHPDAIGILGSDVYDTLVVLQALRERFPDALFFTTDLDARYIEDETIGLTRNLIVAAHDGFEPPDVGAEPGQGQKLPPQFRSSYQTSTYRAVRAALLADGESSKWVVQEDHVPLLFEVGARRIVPLEGVWVPGDGEAHQPIEDRFPLPSWLTALLVLVPLLAVLRLIALITSIPKSLRRELTRADRAARSSRWIGTAILALFGLYAADVVPELYRAHQAGWGEPSGVIAGKGLPGILLGSVNGVSSWATELMRVVAVGLGLRWLFRRIPDRLTTSQAQIRGDLHDDTFCALWDRHDLEADPRRPVRVLAIVIGTALVMGFGFTLLQLTGMPVAPVRSAAWVRFDVVVTMTAVVLMQALVVLGVDQTRRCTAFVWEQVHRVQRLNASQLHEIIDALARRTRVVERGIVYPAVIALLMILSRSRVFDAWTWPFGLIILVGGTLTVLAFTTWWLRSACRELKSVVLARLRDPDLPPVPGAEHPEQLLKWARDCTEQERRGGFSSVLANPVLEAFMLPLVGLVGADVLSGFV